MLLLVDTWGDVGTLASEESFVLTNIVLMAYTTKKYLISFP